MPNTKSTKLNIREDRSTALSSSAQGSNIDAIGFNINFLALRNPKLAIEIIKLYTEAHKVQEGDPKAPDEDFTLFADALSMLTVNASDDDQIK